MVEFVLDTWAPYVDPLRGLCQSWSRVPRGSRCLVRRRRRVALVAPVPTWQRDVGGRTRLQRRHPLRPHSLRRGHRGCATQTFRERLVHLTSSMPRGDRPPW
jgi:hypothetical protein